PLPTTSLRHLHHHYLLFTSLFFFFTDPATTEIYTLSLHDALPIYRTPAAHSVPKTALPSPRSCSPPRSSASKAAWPLASARGRGDRKSTRLNSSHVAISYAVFCLKKKKK